MLLTSSPRLLLFADFCFVMADPGEGMVDFDGDASARLQRTDPPIAVRSDGLRYAPRADARLARHTNLLTPR